MALGNTIQNEVSCRGVGLHSGKMTSLKFVPGNEGEGIVFIRRDLGGVRVPASSEHVISTRLSTIIGSNGASVQTTEHLLGAVFALNIDNLVIEIDGPEVPAMDGSAAPFVVLLLKSGLALQERKRSFIEILKPMTVSEGGKEVSIHPASSFEILYHISFDHPLVLEQTYHYWHSQEAFIREIASARTFAFFKDVSFLRSQGFAQGGSLDNTVVLDDENVLNEQGLRFPDEFVRHKILDLMGDFSLLGMPVLGKVEAFCSGHDLHYKLVKRILRDKKAWRVVSASSLSKDFISYPLSRNLPLPAVTV
ncbi:MAG: UDP-3-O-acyl-N-acetylglucosamine deacetylase [Nitrospiria bacterium]